MIHNNLNELFTDCADAIREKDGTGDVIIADNFPERIRSIVTSDPNLIFESRYTTVLGSGKLNSTTIELTPNASTTDSVAAYDTTGSSAVSKDKSVFFSVIMLTGPWQYMSSAATRVTNTIAIALKPNEPVIKDFSYGDLSYRVEAQLTTNASSWINSIKITNTSSVTLRYTKAYVTCCIYH